VKSTTATLTHIIPSLGRDSVTAVTSLGDDVFIARKQSGRVEIYDARTFTLRKHLHIRFPEDDIASQLLEFRFNPSFDRPMFTGLVACPVNKCLYASYNKNDMSTVHRVELSGSNAVKKWSVARGPTGVSVNNKHNLIVACSTASKLQEYTTHGLLVREICLHEGVTSCRKASVTQPWHAIQLSTGDYVVSHHTIPGVVSVVGVDGQVVRSYGQSQTSDVGLMCCPSSLAVTKHDDILVADKGNNRILLISSSLGSIRELSLPGGDGIQEPRGLCLDESRGRLYVGESILGYSGKARILVFDVVTIAS